MKDGSAASEVVVQDVAVNAGVGTSVVVIDESGATVVVDNVSVEVGDSAVSFLVEELSSVETTTSEVVVPRETPLVVEAS